MHISIQKFKTEISKTHRTEIMENTPLSKICTFRIGGRAELVLSPESAEELITCIRKLRKHSIPYITIGAASNLLFDDRGFNGAVIRTNMLKKVQIENGILTAEAGVPLPKLCRIAAENSMGGLHGLCGIPGTVGGSVITSAGAFGCNIFDHITEIEAYFPSEDTVKTLPLTAADFSYRKSPDILKDAVILRIFFNPPYADRIETEEKMTFCTERRKSTQPHGIPSAGSYWRRPENAPPAAYLIDQAGLKGMRVGDAAVSEKHAGFIVNKGNATANNVLTLAKTVKKAVYESFGITLSEEVKYVPYTPTDI